jgi:hypothetical protein
MDKKSPHNNQKRCPSPIEKDDQEKAMIIDEKNKLGRSINQQ